MKGDASTHTSNPKYRSGFKKLTKACRYCKGKGEVIIKHGGWVTCADCGGTGKLPMGE